MFDQATEVAGCELDEWKTLQTAKRVCTGDSLRVCKMIEPSTGETSSVFNCAPTGLFGSRPKVGRTWCYYPHESMSFARIYRSRPRFDRLSYKRVAGNKKFPVTHERWEEPFFEDKDGLPGVAFDL